jgi:Ser/Thr protein kinase RdoA (MazF antagonist)
MERNWERARQFIELPAAVIEERVRAAFPDARLTAARPLKAGLRNTNYRLEIEGGPSPLVLRLYVADPEACAREAAVLRAMGSRGGRVPVPRVLHADPAAGPPFALLEWLDGVPLDEVLRGEDAASAVRIAAVCGVALAAIHETRFPAPGFLGPQMRVVRPMPAWARTVLSALDGAVEERLGPGLVARVRQTVESNGRAVEAVWSEAVLVHADFKPWNLLVRSEEAGSSIPGRWRLSGVLDWEFACAGSKLIDFATFVRDEAALAPGWSDALADAYRSAGGTLPADWRRLTRLVDLLNLIQMLAWSGGQATEDLRRLVGETLEAA